MSVKGRPTPGFRRAVETDSATLATAAARELPQLALADALRLCLLYARSDPDRFDRAIVRWHGRLCLEAGGLDAPTAHNALVAAIALPTAHGRAAAGLLAAIAVAHDLTDVAEVLDAEKAWVIRRLERGLPL